MPIAQTTAAAPPALASAGGRVQVFWLDRTAPTAAVGVLRHAVVSPHGRIVRSPQAVRRGVDTRLAIPTAVSWGDGIAAAWMLRTERGVIVEIGTFDASGRLRGILRPHPDGWEEGGRLGLAVSVDGSLHAVWSAFDGRQRRIWYARIDRGAAPRGATGPRAASLNTGDSAAGRGATMPGENRAGMDGAALHGGIPSGAGGMAPVGDIDVGLVEPPVPLTSGDAPSLMTDPVLRLLWWEPVEAGAFRLLIAELISGRLALRRALTGAIALVAPLPALPVSIDGTGVLLVPTLERAFSTAGRLYAISVDDVREGAFHPAPAGPPRGVGWRAPIRSLGAPRRSPLLGQTRPSDVAVVQGDGMALAVWSQGAGRRQNSELYAAYLFSPEELLATPARITYTIPGSLRPSVALIDGQPVAAWLEVAGMGQFSLSFATSIFPRRRHFLLGIAEMDLFRPGSLLMFSLLAALSVMPIAALAAALALIPAVVLAGLIGLLAAPFTRVAAFLSRPAIRMGIIVALAGGVQLAARGLLPGSPGPVLLGLPLLCLAVPAVWMLERRRAGPMARMLTGFAVVVVALVIALFPWGARQLSQL